jgi:hypothetical protein
MDKGLLHISGIPEPLPDTAKNPRNITNPQNPVKQMKYLKILKIRKG